MAAGPVFPGFIRVEYQTDGSAKAKFLAEAAQLSGDVKKPFAEAFDQIGKMVDRVSGKFRDGNFKLDLDTSSLRDASAQADFTAKKLAAMRDAALGLATANRDTSETTKAFTQGLQAQAAEAERVSQTARDQLQAYTALQGAVTALTRDNDALAQSYRNTFLEQARAANAAYEAQRKFNALAAPNLNQSTPGRSARDSASVFEAAFADQDASNKELVEKAAATEKAQQEIRRLMEAEAGAARGAKILEEAHRGTALALDYTSKSARESASVFEQMFRAQDESAAAAEKAQAEIRRLMEVEAGAARGAKLLEEAHKGTALALDYAAKSARESASAFELMFQAQDAKSEVAGQRFFNTALGIDRMSKSARDSARVFEEMFAEQDAAARATAERLAASEKAQAAAAAEMQRLGQAAEALNARLNPAVAIQQRFNNEIEEARKLLAAGVISQDLYGQAVERANRDQAASLNLLAAAQDQAANSAKRGTSETQNVINSTRSLRVAGIQAGQQIQDMAIQFQMGTRASVVLAQQLPQLAFALSGLEGNANKTLSKIGQFSTFLAGPWGAAILIAGVALAPLVEKILGTGDAADEAKGKTYDFANGLNVLTLSANNAADAMAQLSNEMRNAIAVQGDFLAGKANVAQQSVQQLQALYDAEGKELAALQKRATALNPMQRLSAAETYRMGALIQNRKPLGEALTNARAADTSAREALLQQRGIEAADPRAAANGRYNRAVGDLRTRFQQSQRDPIGAAAAGKLVTEAQYQAEFARLTAAKDKEIDSLKKKPKGADPAKAAERAQKAAIRLGEFGEDASKKIANIRDSFADIPPEVERVNKATRELDDIISDLQNRKPTNFEQSIAEAEALKKSLPDMAFGRVMRQITEDAQQQVQYQMLILQGRDGEAQALQNIYQIEQNLGPLRKDQKDQIVATGIAMQRINEQMQRASEIQAVFLDATRSVRGEVEAILGGYGKLGDLGATLRRAFQQIQGKILTEQIFGNLFRDMDRYVKEKTGIGSSVDMLAKETERAGTAAGEFAEAINAATARIMGGGSASGGIVAGASAVTAWGNMKIPENIRNPSYDGDPNGPIVVAARKSGSGRTVNDLRPEEYFQKLSQAFGAKFANLLEPLLGKKLAGNLGGVLGGVLEGQATTGTGFGAILGGLKELKGLPEGLSKGLGKAFGGAQTGAQVAGLGSALGIKMSNTGAQIGGAIGSFIPIPGGKIIGSIAGGLLGRLFGGTKSGFAVASNSGVSTGGNSTQAATAGESASSLSQSLSSIAKAFGTSLGDYAVSIGTRSSGYIRVSASGSSRVGDKNYNSGPDVLYDGKDMEAALRIALKNAIEDGAIAGIRAGAKRLLSAGTDIDAQVEKALKFENVFKSLKAIKDPLGAALDELNTEFKDLIAIFKEAGASAEELSSLEELYGIKRAEAIKQANDSILSSLKGLQSSLTIGSDYLSLRDRKSAALAVFNPLADRVKAGDTTAFNDFTDAANSLLDIERQISGSTSAFFDVFNQIKSITDNAITGQENVQSIAAASDSPFASLATQQQATTSAIDAQTSALLGALGAVNDNLVAAVRQLIVNGDTSSASSAAQSIARGYF